MDIKTAADVAKKSWSLYRENAGKEKDWDAIVEESSRILREAGNGREAFHIVWGFLKALEEEDIHGKSNDGS